MTEPVPHESELKIKFSIEFQELRAIELADILIGLRSYLFRSVVRFSLTKLSESPDSYPAIGKSLDSIAASYAAFVTRPSRNGIGATVPAFERNWPNSSWPYIYPFDETLFNEWMRSEIPECDLAISEVHASELQFTFIPAYLIWTLYPDVPYSFFKDALTYMLNDLKTGIKRVAPGGTFDSVPRILSQAKDNPRIKSMSIRCTREEVAVDVNFK